MKLASGKNKKTLPATNIKPNTSDNNITRNLIGNSTISLNQSVDNNKNRDIMMSPTNQVSRKVY